MNCAEVEELAGAYTLRALPEDEMRAVEEHLAGCDKHPEFAELAAASAELPYSAPEGDPSPELKTRIMEAIHADLPPAVPVREKRGLFGGFFGGWSLPRLAPYGLAAAAVAVVVLFVTATTILDSGDSSSNQTVVQLQDPSGAASGQITIDEEAGTAAMQVEGLEVLPDDLTYQVWAITDGAPVGLGIFDAEEDGTATTEMETDLSGVDTVAITVEPAGGSDLPTTDPLLAAEL